MKRETRVKCIKYKRKNTIMKRVLEKKKKKILCLGCRYWEKCGWTLEWKR